jgi:hypothetical protein
MFQNGPAFMQLRELHDELDELRKQALGDGYISDKFESRSLNYRDLNKDKYDADMKSKQ